MGIKGGTTENQMKTIGTKEGPVAGEGSIYGHTAEEAIGPFSASALASCVGASSGIVTTPTGGKKPASLRSSSGTALHDHPLLAGVTSCGQESAGYRISSAPIGFL